MFAQIGKKLALLTASALTIVVFILDLNASLGVAAGVLYVLPVATLLAFLGGILSLVRYYSRHSLVHLYVGAGLIGTGILGGLHGAITSSFCSTGSIRSGVSDFLELECVTNFPRSGSARRRRNRKQKDRPGTAGRA